MTHRRFELIEHPADMGLRVFGKDLKELFVNAACGMFSIIAERKINSHKAQETIAQTIAISANNYEELLVCWLSELLTLFDINKCIFVGFEITQLTKTKLQSLAFKDPAGLKDYLINTEIKAVTYHQLKIRKQKNKFVAEIIFDT